MTREQKMEEAVEHMRTRVAAVGGNLARYYESSECYRLVASLPATGETETIWLQWDADHQEPRFFWKGRDAMKGRNAVKSHAED